VTLRLLVLSAALAAAAPEQAVRILEKNCWSCHGPAVALSGLRLDSRDALEKGGRRGSVLKDDLLVRAISRQDARLVMPPTDKLADADIATLKAWVAAGAEWPKTTQISSAKWWSFVKPVATPNSTVDSFIDKLLAARKITAAPPASKRILIRRATFDLHGPAPTQSEIEAFEKDASPKAFETLIDRLLASSPPRATAKSGPNTGSISPATATPPASNKTPTPSTPGATVRLSPTVRQKFRDSWRPLQKSSGQLVLVLAESQ